MEEEEVQQKEKECSSVTMKKVCELIEKVKNVAIDLEKDGYAVIDGVLSLDECRKIIDDMWNHWDEISDGKITAKTDFTQTGNKLKLPQHQHGIMQSYRINHLKVIDDLRTRWEFIFIYSLLYGSDQLTCSQDRFNFKFPGRKYKSLDSWPHADQHPGRLGRITIQSYVTMLDCDENSPGNRFYRGSHAIFDTFFAEKRRHFKNGDWNKLTTEEKIALPKLCPLVKPVCKAGSMVLWDSRTVHDPDDGSDFVDGRFVVYVCYNLMKWVNNNNNTNNNNNNDDGKKTRKKDVSLDSLMAEKRTIFTECLATSHSPLPISKFPKVPRHRGGERNPYDEIPLEKLGRDREPNEKEKYLFGFKRYENTEGCLLGDENWIEHYHLEGVVPLLEFVNPYTPLVPAPSNLKDDRGKEKKRKISTDK